MTTLLLGTGTLESPSLVDDLRWMHRSRGIVVFVDPPLSAFVSFLFFSFLSFGRVCAASAPAPIVGCIGWLLCNTKRGETLFRK